MAKSGSSAYDLAVGEPELLQEAMLFARGPRSVFSGSEHYPHLGGEPGLLEELRVRYPQYRHAVVTSGAKQALLASFYALREVEGKRVVHHPAPYWPSYPTLAALSGMQFASGLSVDHSRVECVTFPNNPDGSQVLDPERLYSVWDSVYADPTYGWGGREPDHRIRVGSAAKLLGMSGARVGWLLTNEEDLAQAAALYVESTTSGVSKLSQVAVAGALAWVRINPEAFALVQQTARNQMGDNVGVFNSLLQPRCEWVAGVPCHGRGMFSYFCLGFGYAHAFAEAIEQVGVALVPGEACGASCRGVWRMNMMANRERFAKAFAALKKVFL